VVVDDRVQLGYRYTLVAPIGRDLHRGPPASTHAEGDAGARRPTAGRGSVRRCTGFRQRQGL